MNKKYDKYRLTLNTKNEINEENKYSIDAYYGDDNLGIDVLKQKYLAPWENHPHELWKRQAKALACHVHSHSQCAVAGNKIVIRNSVCPSVINYRFILGRCKSLTHSLAHIHLGTQLGQRDHSHVKPADAQATPPGSATGSSRRDAEMQADSPARRAKEQSS